MRERSLGRVLYCLRAVYLHRNERLNARYKGPRYNRTAQSSTRYYDYGKYCNFFPWFLERCSQREYTDTGFGKYRHHSALVEYSVFFWKGRSDSWNELLILGCWALKKIKNFIHTRKDSTRFVYGCNVKRELCRVAGSSCRGWKQRGWKNLFIPEYICESTRRSLASWRRCESRCVHCLGKFPSLSP